MLNVNLSAVIVYAYMGKQPNGGESDVHDQQESRANKNAVLMILGDIADTAWRMFIPTIGATILGLSIDKTLHTTPWIMIIMMIIGIAVAALLVQRQLKRVS